jgi:hypothetical protein
VKDAESEVEIAQPGALHSGRVNASTGAVRNADREIEQSSFVFSESGLSSIASALAVREFPFQRLDINHVHRVLNSLPFPIYVENRKCPEGNQIEARH